MEISVVLPVHNCGKHLFPALQSLKYQSYPHFEVLMVNDHSSDGSDLICAGFASVDDRFRLLDSPYSGMVRALNYGIFHASGVYIARMEGDGVSDPDRFAKQVEFLRENPDIAFLGSFANHIDENGKVLGSFEFPEDDLEIKAHLDRGTNSFVHASMMICRKTLNDLEGYREVFSICQDYDLWLRAQERYAFANLPEKLLHSRGFPQKREIDCQFWRYFYVTKLAEISAQQRRSGQMDPVEQMVDEFDVDAIADRMVRQQLISARQDYYCNKRAFVDRKPLNSMDIEQVKTFLLNNKPNFNTKTLASALELLFDQAMRIEDSESAEILYKLQREVSKSRHIKSMLTKPGKLFKYALRKRLEEA